MASPETTLRTATRYPAISNARASDFANQATPVELASGHRPDAPTRTVLQGAPSRPTRRMAVRVPRGSAPGIYLLLVFDGSEGGAHTTWDYVQVSGTTPAAPAGATTTQRAIAAPAHPGRPRTVEVAVIAALVGILAGGLLARTRRAARTAR